MDLAQLHAQQTMGWAVERQSGGRQWFEQIVERLLDFTNVGLGQSVLNVGASGLSAMVAGQRGAQVTAIIPPSTTLPDTRPALPANGRAAIEIHEAHASHLPFPDHSFDVILSVFGLQFEPDPDAVAREIARVARPGAVLGLVFWDTSSPLGDFMGLLGRFLDQPDLMAEAAGWGRADEAESRLSPYFGELEFRFGNIPLVADSAEALWDSYLRLPSPVRDAIDRLDAERGAMLSIAAIEQFRQYEDLDNRIEWPREYLLVRGLRLYP